MPVLIEALSVVIKRSSIDEKYVGGWPALEEQVPNNTLCYDDEIVRVGFMMPDDAKAFMRQLQVNGLALLKDGKAVDFVGVHQIEGLMATCDWLEFLHTDLTESGSRVAICRLVGTSIWAVVAPPNWEYEGSLSQKCGVGNTADTNHLKFLRHEKGIDVYLNPETGDEVFVGRTGK